MIGPPYLLQLHRWNQWYVGPWIMPSAGPKGVMHDTGRDISKAHAALGTETEYTPWVPSGIYDPRQNGVLKFLCYVFINCRQT